MQDVIDVYNRHKLPGVSTTFVYNNYIYPQFRISITTLYSYLATPVKKQLKEIGQPVNQLSLFSPQQ
jgi:hypothetical protein